MDLSKSLGFHFNSDASSIDEDQVIQYINLKLAALGYPSFGTRTNSEFLEIARNLLNANLEKNRELTAYLCPADQRIQQFLDDYLKDAGEPVSLPVNTFILDRHGLARMMSLPPDGDSFVSDIVSTYRVRQGILHNPQKDRRTTQGVFHIAEGGLPIPDDKIAVPKRVFRNLLAVALKPPENLLQLPFTSSQKDQAKLLVSLLLRPTVCPEVPGYIPQKSLEIRFFAPGSMIGNLDFVESIFGNAGDPYLPKNDAGLDADHWTGHTGCVILAPHLIQTRKKDLGLPHFDQASERQRRDGQCWKKEDEPYNGGQAFKITARDARGVMITLIADNYFGYCKKEVKTQISFSANLYGLCEEEHAGGAIAFPNYDLGEEFHLEDRLPQNGMTFRDVASMFGDIMEIKPEGYGVDKNYADILYVPEDARFDMSQKSVTWTKDGREQKIKLLASNTYILPSGYKVRMKKQTGGPSWHLFGTSGEGTLCHKPSTVSGGGKSEISKSIVDAMIQGPIFSSEFHKDLELMDEILKKDFSGRFRDQQGNGTPSRKILDSKRSLGSVIKLLTPSAEYTDDYNAWLQAIPPHIRDLIFVLKRFYKPEWGDQWRDQFSVDVINGHLGHELKFHNRKLVANYLRVGREQDGSWRIYKVRQDFSAAEKLQVEDDITASVVVPSDKLTDLNPAYTNPSVKMVVNCEYRLFQRPDDAIHRGYDKQAEADLASPGSFLSNYEPLTLKDAQEIVEDAAGFDLYTEPMKNLLRDFVNEGQPTYFASSSHPRIVDGKPSKNPRYLQNRPDVMNPRQKYLAEIGTRLFRKVPLDKPVHFPVNSVLAGRRNNPPDLKAGVPPLAVYNPIHYQELPELFMDFICSVTGKSPSTTGFGSEGALTKGPFNALWPIVDMNNALVSFITTGYHGFTSAAGHIGPKVQVDHDISLLVPEIWCRMSVQEREPEFLIKNGYLEPLSDFDHKGRKILASRLGYHITIKFVLSFLGRIFNSPNAVFSEEMLKPEKQGLDVFVEGIDNIVATQQRVAEHYFADGSVEAACPPLKALLHIMAKGRFEGKDIQHPDVRALFTRESLLSSDWYRERLQTRQTREIALWRRHVSSLEKTVEKAGPAGPQDGLRLQDRLAHARAELQRVQSPAYLQFIQGTIGADPLKGQPSAKPLVESAVAGAR
jgi:phosphoenolpyruvate carboxykinase (diphosphate)